MTLTRISLGNPVAVIVAGILVAIFGIISVTRLPVEMTPEISRPNILITTGWRASAPNEIESEICLLYTSPSPRDGLLYRMPSSA